MPKHKHNYLGPRPYKVCINVSVMLKAQVSAICDIYDAAQTARGTGAKASTSALGNNDQPRPKAIIENDILFIAIANWDSICRFDNMTPASRCKLTAAAIACSLPIPPPRTMVNSPVVGPTPEHPLTPESEDDAAVSQMPGYHL